MLIGCLTSEPLQLHAGQQGAAFFMNSAKQSCQAIHDCTFDISQSSFEDNAGILGGAIDMTVDSLAVSVTDSNFTGNSAQTSMLEASTLIDLRICLTMQIAVL